MSKNLQKILKTTFEISLQIQQQTYTISQITQIHPFLCNFSIYKTQKTLQPHKCYFQVFHQSTL